MKQALLLDVANITANLEYAQQVMREATAEVTRQRRVIATYRRQDSEHEKLIGEVYQLLKDGNADDAYDLVRAEYLAIHGPSD